MNDRETRRYDMFGRIKAFITDNAADFAEVHHGAQNDDNALIQARFQFRWENKFKGAEVYAKA